MEGRSMKKRNMIAALLCSACLVAGSVNPAGLCRLHIGTAQSSGTDLGLWCDIIQVFMLILICNGHHLHLIGTYIKIFHHCLLLSIRCEEL